MRPSSQRHQRRARSTSRPTSCMAGVISAAGRAERSSTSNLFAGAKQVTLIEAYSEKLGAKQFDLLIDWGWFYFITKPLFKLLHWLVPGARQLRPRHPRHHRAREGRVLPARQQELRVDGQDEEAAAGDGEAARALQGRPRQAAAGADGALQEREDQPDGGLPADRCCRSRCSSRSTRCCSSPSTCAMRRSSAGSRTCRRPIRPRCSTCSGCCPIAVPDIPARRRVAAHHGHDDVGADAAEPAAARPRAAEDLQLDAGDLHFHAGVVPVGPGDLLGLEQRAVAAAAVHDHAQEQHRDPPLEEPGRRQVEGAAGRRRRVSTSAASSKGHLASASSSCRRRSGKSARSAATARTSRAPRRRRRHARRNEAPARRR